MRWRGRIGCSAALATALIGLDAHAQPTPASSPSTPGTEALSPRAPMGPSSPPDAVRASDSSAIAQARAAFVEGLELAKEERLVDAIAAFDRSDSLHPHAITTYNIGYCERLLGHPTRARKMLAKALADDRAHGSVELPADLVSASHTYLDEVEKQIAHVVVTITPGVVTVDGRPLELVTTAGPRPVLVAGTRSAGPGEAPPSLAFEVQADPGQHVFVLSVNGRSDVVRNEILTAGAQISFELRGPPPTGSTDVAPAPVGAVAAATTLGDKPSRLPAFIAFGIAAAGVAAGTVAGMIAIGDRSSVNAACAPPPDNDPVEAMCHSKHAAATAAADISTVSFVAGGVGAAVGAVLLLTAPRGTKTGSGTAAQKKLGPEVHLSIGWSALSVEGRL